MTVGRSCVYEIDQRACLVNVDEEWTRFALENDAPHLLPPDVLGTSLFDHISDSTTAHLYEQLLAESTRRQTSIVVPIRCDAPAAKRFLSLEIRPLPSGHRIVSTTVRTERRDPVALLDVRSSRSTDWIRVCSWCKSVDVAGTWKNTEDAVRELHLLDRDVMPQITHAICGGCRASIEALLPDDPSHVTG